MVHIAAAQEKEGASKLITKTEVEAHSTPDSCWTIIHGKVYDITPFLGKHPGGWIINLSGGRDATVMYETYHVNPVSKKLLDKFFIGDLAGYGKDGGSYYSWEDASSSGFYPTLQKRVSKRLKEIGR